MADLQVSNTAAVKPVTETEAPQKAEGAVKKFLGGLKDALFGKTGTAVMAGAASGALIAGLPGAAVGAVVGLGTAAAVKASDDGKKGLSALNAGLAGAVAGLAFGLPGLLVGGAAFAFASGAAQKAGEKIANFIKGNQDKSPEPAPAQ